MFEKSKVLVRILIVSIILISSPAFSFTHNYNIEKRAALAYAKFAGSIIGTVLGGGVAILVLRGLVAKANS